MDATPFKRDYYGEYACYLAGLGEDNCGEFSMLKKRLAVAMAEELTDRQRQMAVMYYVEQRNMVQIARELGVNVSTVSRTLSRARTRLRRCLRYGARTLLEAAEM